MTFSRFPTDSWEFVVLNGELIIPGTSASGKELYATDGQSLRLVADIAPGPQDSNPIWLKSLNNYLTFMAAVEQPSGAGGAATYTFVTDGSATEQLPIKFNPQDAAVLGNEWIHIGRRGSEPFQLYSYDGVSSTLIDAPWGNLSFTTEITTAGNHAYFIGGSGSSRGIYRTDGTIATKVATYEEFTTISDSPRLFELKGSLFVALSDDRNDQLVFYRTEGNTPVEVLRWPKPTEVHFPNSVSPRWFSDGESEYFSLYTNTTNRLYRFDGSSLERVAEADRTATFKFSALGERMFVNAVSSFPTTETTLYEIVDDNLVPIGPGLDYVVMFRGTIFGTSRNGSFNAGTLYRLDNDHLVSLGDFVKADGLLSNPRFVEYNGQLYFSGQDGRNMQLYAIVPIPESSSLAILVITALSLSITRTSRIILAARKP